MITAFINGIIFSGEEFIYNKVLVIDGRKIKGIVEQNEIPSDAQVVDCKGGWISSGFIDLQVYGGGGVLFSDAPSVQALHQMGGGLLASGTTSFLITLATNSLDVFRQAILVTKENPHPAVLGLHLEGPYLNPVKRGAHLLEFVRKPDTSELKDLLENSGGVVKMMTVAPEICPVEFIETLKKNDVVISAGHSNATFEQGNLGFSQGIKAATHLFNAMSPFNHRETGLPGAIFKSERVSSSIVADGIHVSFNALEMSKKIMGERLFLITDAVEESAGVYPHIRDKDRFIMPDGTLSGSSLTMMKAVANCVHQAGIPLEEALRMATLYPARVIGADNLGRITEGADADLVVFNQEFQIKAVFSKGKQVK
ncbi:N-acetylglucosamine-6-phosphate deacetylase [Desertivirga arenae]|uniref:N-acetylglucosamine-6-phosphate deacetylase n=1 Tax=Desertivirga arenae TaxID=2810309 RepID=UPI001A973519|nr:N-acetylglucosamine-6-phosphate deacetylase [Pedobacter sp. SYSU D00823]